MLESRPSAAVEQERNLLPAGRSPAPGERLGRFRSWRRPSLQELLFGLFCLIVFSRIGWYDLRVYWPAEDRRAFLTASHSAWVVAQFLFYGLLTIPLVHRVRQHSRIILFWVLATLPYFLIGALDGRLGIYFLADIARYALPIGYLLYLCLAVQNLDERLLSSTIIASMAFYVILRLPFHLYLTPTGRMRYGVAWEVFLMISLVALSARMRGRRLIAAAAAVLSLAVILTFGLSRSMLLGSAIGAGLVALLAWLPPAPQGKARVTGVAALAVLTTLMPMLLAPMSRLSLTGVMKDSNIELVTAAVEILSSEDAPSSETAHSRTGTGALESHEATSSAAAIERDTGVLPAPSPIAGVPGESPPLGKPMPAPTSEEAPGPSDDSDSLTPVERSSLDQAKHRWEDSIFKDTRSIDSRITESVYFLEKMRYSKRDLLLGSGAGWSVSITAGRQTRIVRGAHNTYLTLLFRHGIILGSAIIAFLLLYGLPESFRKLRRARTPGASALLSSLIAYRITAALLALFHQGLFDDPIVLLSIAVAIGPGRGDLRRSPVGEPEHLEGPAGHAREPGDGEGGERRDPDHQSTELAQTEED